MTTDIATILARTYDTNTSLAITDVVAMVPLTMTAVKDAHGYIADRSTIALKCSRGHMHKYYQREVVRGNVYCVTCNYGTKFLKLVRETAEDALGIPFIINASDDFVNMAAGITITCHKMSGVDYAEGSHVHIYKTESRKKILATLHKYLTENTCKLSAAKLEKLITGKKTKARPMLRREIIHKNINQLPLLYLEDFVGNDMISYGSTC